MEREWLQFTTTEDPSPAHDHPLSEPAPLVPTTRQIPTPPVCSITCNRLLSLARLQFCCQISQQGSPTEEPAEANTIVSVSTTFFPGANLCSLPTDLVVLSSDAVFFYVHSHQLLEASENGFASLLPIKSSKGDDEIGPMISLPEHSTVLNVVFHTIYHMSSSHYSTTILTLAAAVDALHKYGVSLPRYIGQTTPLYTQILSIAPIAPIETYALAAHYDLYDLAVRISSHLLAFSLPSLTDDHANRMGPIYLKRLFFLHLGRIDALKRLLLPPPHPHAPTPTCDFVEQKKLTRAWALASAYLAWDARPGT